jgi:diguanylate cyclase (GGDEF)-like protein/PAS domain S-box-containing protein
MADETRHPGQAIERTDREPSNVNKGNLASLFACQLAQMLESVDEQLKLQTAALDASTNSIVITDRTAKILWVNTAFTASTGYAAEEVISRTPRVWKSGKHSQEFYRQLWDTILRGKVWHGEVVNRRKDGTLYTEEMSISPVLSKHGEILHFVANKQDLDRKRAEENLRHSEENYRRLLANIPDVTWTATEDRRTSYISPNVERIYGYTAQEILDGKADIWLSRIHPEDRERVDRAFQRLFSHDEPFDLEYRIQRKDGEWVWFNDRAMRVQEQNGIRLADGVLSDVTARKRAELALVDSEKRYRLLFETNLAGVFRAELGGKILDSNPALLQILGYESQQELTSRSTSDMLFDPEEEKALIARLSEEAVLRNFEIRLRRKDGSPVWALHNLNLATDKPGRAFVEGTIIDISERKRAEEELRWKTAFLEAQTNSTVDGILVVDARGQTILRNQRFGEIFKVPQELLASQDDAPTLQYVTSVVRNPDEFVRRVEYLYRHPIDTSRDEVELNDGRVLDRYSSPVVGKDGVNYGRIWTFRDITDRKRAEQQVKDREDSLRLLLESTAEAIYGIDLNGCCTFCNPACLRMLGYEDTEQLLGKNMHDLIHHSRADGSLTPKEQCRIFRAFRTGHGTHADDEVLWRADGTCFPAEYWAYPQRKETQVVGAVVTFVDISNRKRDEERIQFLAFYDALTGLPNRTLLQDRLAQSLASASRRNEKVALLFLDLDRFKLINDSLGHTIGDLLLKEVAGRLKKNSREQDTVSRLGGDEFIVVVSAIKNAEEAGVIAQRIMRAVSARFNIQGHVLNVTCSMGITIFPDDGADAETLIKNADAAMYCGKENGRNNYQFFTEAMSHEVVERLTLESNLRLALERNELFLVYQPQVEVASGRVIGAEALLRWRHPELGLVPPDKFISVAEAAGLIIPIGEWVLRNACAQVREWQKQGLPAVLVAVNVSAAQFRHEGFLQVVKRVLNETGLPAECLELEVTESLLLSNADVMVSLLRDLKQMGLKLSIDDFGTGYSSLSYLRHFPVHKLKVDRSFVRDAAVDPDSAAITSTIINMAKSLDLKVIAEGVETEEQMGFLRAHHCDEYQGFLFSKPLPPEEFARCLQDNFTADLHAAYMGQ